MDTFKRALARVFARPETSVDTPVAPTRFELRMTYGKDSVCSAYGFRLEGRAGKFQYTAVLKDIVGHTTTSHDAVSDEEVQALLALLQEVDVWSLPENSRAGRAGGFDFLTCSLEVRVGPREHRLKFRGAAGARHERLVSGLRAGVVGRVEKLLTKRVMRH